jgi:antitoxin (DNA-binding transcriptional repressor) of toxin-antitoxin stability system
MRAVGIRELKAHLSRYLREVEDGEVVLVTDRGRVVAELRAPGVLTPRAVSDLDRRLRDLATRVPLAIGEPHEPSVYRVSPVRVPPGTAEAMLDEEREEEPGEGGPPP